MLSFFTGVLAFHNKACFSQNQESTFHTTHREDAKRKIHITMNSYENLSENVY